MTGPDPLRSVRSGVMRIESTREALGWTAVGVASASLIWIVPENPLTNLDDPSHWGLIGYCVLVPLLARRPVGPLDRPGSTRRLLIGFLVGMPLIYLADWIRFAGELGFLWIELGGAAIYWSMALGVGRWPILLPIGIATHGLWDLGHYGAVSFVPDWYAMGCAVVDFAMGIFVISRFRPPGA